MNQSSKGSFKNSLDQIFPNFDDLPPSNGEFWTFYIPGPLLSSVDFLLYWPPTYTSSCPRSYWMTPKCKGASWEKKCKYKSVKQLQHVRPYLIVSNRNLQSKSFLIKSCGELFYEKLNEFKQKSSNYTHYGDKTRERGTVVIYLTMYRQYMVSISTVSGLTWMFFRWFVY